MAGSCAGEEEPMVAVWLIDAMAGYLGIERNVCEGLLEKGLSEELGGITRTYTAVYIVDGKI